MDVYDINKTVRTVPASNLEGVSHCLLQCGNGSSSSSVATPSAQVRSSTFPPTRSSRSVWWWKSSPHGPGANAILRAPTSLRLSRYASHRPMACSMECSERGLSPVLLARACSIFSSWVSLLSGVQPHINAVAEFWRPGSRECGSLLPVLV
jgi:hypothetical protein